MTPAPQPSADENIDPTELLDGASGSDAFDPDSVDVDFEQELEALFADDLEEESAAVVETKEEDKPVVLDDLAAEEEETLVLDDIAEEVSDDDIPVLDDVVEDGDEDLLILDDVVEDAVDDTMLLDNAVEDVGKAESTTLEEEAVSTLVDDIAEENDITSEAVEEEIEEIIELDDLTDDGDVEELADLDALLDEVEDEETLELNDVVEAETAPVEGVVEEAALEESAADSAATGIPADEIAVEDTVVLEDALETTEAPAPVETTDSEVVEEAILEDIVEMPEEPAEALAETSTPEIPMDETMVKEDIDFMDESGPQEGVSPLNDSGESDIIGLDELEEDDDMDSLLDTVEVDMSDIDMPVEGENVPEAGIDMEAALVAESIPQDAGIDVSEDMDVDQLLANVCEDACDPVIANLQDKVAALEARVEELENQLRHEIAQMVPVEAARIIREEIAALKKLTNL